MKIHYFTKYSRQGASSRLRSFQYFPILEQNGFDVCVYPLFGDDYLENLYSGRKNATAVLKAYRKRLKQILLLKKGDFAVIEYELFPYLPAWAEKWLVKKGVRYMTDYDDAIFHNYDLHSRTFIRKLLSNKIPEVMRCSSVVIAGNSYLAEKAASSGCENVVSIPTVVDISRYAAKQHSLQNETLVIGWIGTASTLKYLQQIIPVLEKSPRKIKLHIVGPTEGLKTSLSVQYMPWTEDSEAESIQTFDIGIMPLQDSPWERGKCGYKLIQYMASGLPVIASGVGVNNQIVEQGINGFVANNEEEWLKAIDFLALNRQKLAEMGSAGRLKAVAKYSLQHTGPLMINVLNEFTV